MNTNRLRNTNLWQRKALSVLVGLCFASPIFVEANPTGQQVVAGQVTFNPAGNVFTITNSPGSIINWRDFSIANDETTRFIQQNANSWVLNRIVGQDPSHIFGALQSNGKVFLINPNGVMFGANSRVDTAGLVASSLNISDADVKNGNLHFTGASSAGSVINQGSITTPSGGQVFLIAPHVENNGIINSANGQVILAAGHEVQLVDSGDPNLHVVISAPADQAINLGQIISQGGRIGIYGALVNQRGVVNANSAVVGQDGKVVFKATDTTLLEDGSITSATGAGKGGNVLALGNHVGVFGNASVDASGNLGGGSVLIGGDAHGDNPAVMNASRTFFSSAATIKADALGQGDGGKVVLWSNDATYAYGSISSKGGLAGGNGGFVETSGHFLDANGALVNTFAPKGKSGTWLLDPYDINITGGSELINQTGGNPNTFTGSVNIYSLLLPATIATNLNAGTSVVVDTTGAGTDPGNITLGGVISASPSANVNLTFKANNNININSDIISTGNPITVTLTPLSTGTVTINGNITTNNGNIVINGGSGVTIGSAGYLNTGSTGNAFQTGNTSFGGISSVNITLTNPASTINVQSNGNSGTMINTGGNASGGGLSLQANTITLGGLVNAHAGSVQIQAGAGGVDNSSGGLITGASLSVTSGATATISGANSIGSVTANVSNGNFNFQNDSTALTVGNLNAATGNVVVNTAGNITVSGASSVSGSTTTLNAGGNLDVQGSVSANASNMLTLNATGSTAISGSVTGAAGLIGISGPGGISFTGSGHVSSNGPITLTAGSADALISMASGTEIENSGSIITLNADKMNLNGMICAMGGHAILEPYTGGINIFVAATTHTAASSQLELTNADLSTLSQSPNVRIGNGSSGPIDVKSPLTAGLQELTLMTGYPITQQAGATLGGSTSLNLLGSSVNLQEANPTGVIAGSASSGTFLYRSSNGIAVNQIDGINGVSSSSGIFLQSDSSSSGIQQQVAAPLVTSGALGLKTIGPVSLTSTTNSVGQLVADLNVGGTGTGGFQFLNAGSLDVHGPAYSITGVTTNNQPISIGSFGTLTISQPVNAGTGHVNLYANGLSLGAVVTGSDGNIQPATPGRNITVGSSSCQAAPCLAITNLFDMNVATLGIGTENVSRLPGNIYVAGITVGGSNATDINAATTRIGLLTGGSNTVSQGGAITVQDLGVEAGGAITLGSANAVTNFVANSNGAISFSNGNALNITTLSGGTGNDAYSVSGINTNGAGAISLATSAGSLTIGAPVTASGNAVTLSSAGAIVAGGLVTGSSLNASASGGIGNGSALHTAVSTLSATNAGANSKIQISNTGVLTLNNITQTTGGSTGSIIIDNAGAMTVASGQTVHAQNGAITLNAHSPLTIDGTVSDGTAGITLSAGATGSTADKLTVSSGGVVQSTGPVSLSAGDAIITTGSVIGSPVTQSPYLNTPPLPTLTQCIATPTLAGCSQVLPSLATCTSLPTTPGCSVVLPTLATCTTTPSTAGCSAVLPSLTTCTSTPSTPGCSAVLPSLATCTTNPITPGCSAVIPSLATCISDPSTPGCSIVLPTLASCISNPTVAGCSVVLPSIASCTATPSLPGCTVVLPSLASCTNTPTLPGCSAVLPSLATCTVSPTAPGCSAVLPSLASCVTNPATAGCSAVLPALTTCIANPSATGCSVVLPSVASCTITPSLPGCSAVLPSLATCTTAPSTQGCSAVLPSIASCTTAPTTPGCTAVLPNVSDCVANRSLPGCEAVLPGVAQCSSNPSLPGCSSNNSGGTSSNSSDPVVVALNTTVNLLDSSNSAVTPSSINVSLPSNGNSGSSGGSSASNTDNGQTKSSNDPTKNGKTAAGSKTSGVKDDTATKLYCN